MPRKGHRLTIARGIYREGPDGPYEIRVVVGGHTYYDRRPADATPAELDRAWHALKGQGLTSTPPAQRGTLRADARRYILLIQHLATWKDRQTHLEAWCAGLGHRARYRITEADVLMVRNQLLARGLAPKTVNEHVGTLRNLYHRLDGPKAPTPCDGVTPLPVPKTIIQRVSDADILAVEQELQRRERAGILPTAKTRARFRVFVSTGKRPCEIMRAQPGDVDLTARVWVPRDAKGGFCPGVYLNDDMLAAWQLFIKADAWGPYNHGAFARSIRAAGWPMDRRPYQARHSTWIAASERGIDLEDIAAGAGHTDSRLTRRMYVPILNSRLQRLGEALEGRFQGWPVVPKSGSAKKRQKQARKRRR